MKILHITHLYPQPTDPLCGGVIHRQVKALGSRGCMEKVVSPIPWSPFPTRYWRRKWREYSEIGAYRNVDGIDVYFPRYLSIPKMLFYASSGKRMHWGIRKVVGEIRREFPFELLHAHMGLPDGYAAMLISMRLGLPFVVTVRSTDIDVTAQKNRGCLSALQTVFSSVGRLICPSPRLAKALESRFGVEAEVIPHGIDPSAIFTGVPSLPAEHKNRRIILSVGRLIPTKGIDINMRVVSKLVKKHDRLLYIVVGDGPERRKLERLARELGIAEHVCFVGHLPHSRVMEYMAGCEVFALPSWRETFGLVYIEAMAHARPVVAVRGQGVDGIVEHGKTGLLVTPRDGDSLFAALDFLLTHPEEARAIGERARELVLNNYTWERNADKTIEVYREVLSSQ